jgi:hypothetical protein
MGNDKTKAMLIKKEYNKLLQKYHSYTFGGIKPQTSVNI